LQHDDGFVNWQRPKKSAPSERQSRHIDFIVV